MSLLAGLATGAYAQGTVGSAGSLTSNAGQYGAFYIDNENNTAGSDTASTSGLVYINGTAIVGGQDVNFAVYDGSSLVVALFGSAASGDAEAIGGAGTFTDNSTDAYYDTLSTGGATRTLTLEAWTGSSTTYPVAFGAGVYEDTVTFSQALGNAPGVPTPSTPVTLTSMPSMNLVAVPEPTTLALAGLGGAALLALRRKKA